MRVSKSHFTGILGPCHKLTSVKADPHLWLEIGPGPPLAADSSTSKIRRLASARKAGIRVRDRIRMRFILDRHGIPDPEVFFNGRGG